MRILYQVRYPDGTVPKTRAPYTYHEVDLFDDYDSEEEALQAIEEKGDGWAYYQIVKVYRKELL